MTQTEVPHLVGLPVPQARETGHEAGVVVTARDADGPPLGALTWPGTWIVTAQDPTAGRRVPRGTAVVIEFEEYPDAGGAGDREPRRPLPTHDAAEADPVGERGTGDRSAGNSRIGDSRIGDSAVADSRTGRAGPETG